MSTPATQRILTDVDGRPIPQFFDWVSGVFAAIGGRGRGMQIVSDRTHYVDSTTNLAANNRFIGTTRDLGTIPRCSKLTARAFASHAGTLFIEQSRNGAEGTWRCPAGTPSHSIAVAAGESRQITVDVVAQFWRVNYLNGGTTQTEFELISAEVGT